MSPRFNEINKKDVEFNETEENQNTERKTARTRRQFNSFLYRK
jgi:hypothetical protein